MLILDAKNVLNNVNSSLTIPENQDRNSPKKEKGGKRQNYDQKAIKLKARNK